MFVDVRERERNIDRSPPICNQLELNHDLCMCPDWGSDLFWCVGCAPTNWATWPGLCSILSSSFTSHIASLLLYSVDRVTGKQWLRWDKFTRTIESCGGKGTARPLLREESSPTLAMTGFYWLNLHRNTRSIWKTHQSLSGSNNQIDNIQRTLRAYFESGSDS